jgi:hypothetical protein
VSVSSVDQLHELLAATRLELDRDDLARLGTMPVRHAPAASPPELNPSETT